MPNNTSDDSLITGPISEVLARPVNKPHGMMLLLSAMIVIIIGFVIYGAFLLNEARIATTDRALRWEARYESLFEDYRQLENDCRNATDCKTTAPEISEVPTPSAGEPGTNGSDGLDGINGTDGTDGKTPTFSELLTVFGVYCSELICVGPPGPIGPSGSIGANGSAGVNGTVGATGADSTIPGPVGATGADSTIPGPIGATGESPFSWTTTRTLNNNTIVVESCSRTEPFDLALPTYTCVIN